MSRGFSFTGMLKDMGKAVDRSVDFLENQAAPYVGQGTSGSPAGLFGTGNIVCLYPSAVAARKGALQIIMGPNGQLIVNGNGVNAPNAHWTIINEGHHKIRLHNQNNFIAVANKMLYLLNVPGGRPSGVESLFYLSTNASFIQLQSAAEPSINIGIDAHGNLFPNAKEYIYRNFTPQLIYTPYTTSPYVPQVTMVAQGPAPGMAPPPQQMGQAPPPQTGQAPPPQPGTAPAYQEKAPLPPAYQP